MSIVVRLLGPVDVRRDDTITPIGAPKRRTMLAALALATNRPVPLDSLLERLWGGSAPRTATQGLRSHAHALRAVLGTRLVTHDGAYELRLAPDELDVTLFASLADRGAAALAAGDMVAAVAACGRALGLWRGTALPGVPRTAQLDAILAGLTERRLGVFEDYCAARLAGGATHELAPDLRRCLTAHPFRERAWALLMLAQYRSGDIHGALTSYADAQSILRDQLGVNAKGELAALHHAVLTRDRGLDGPYQWFGHERRPRNR
jgi:DNA-binding SARP family transcriptional activator